MARRHDILQQDATLFHLSHSMAPGEAASPITRITPIIRSGASSMPFLTSPDHRVQEAAAEALTILAGVGEDRLWPASARIVRSSSTPKNVTDSTT
ncbi:MAG: hypothetical protein ACKO2P_08610 [Planctomycetota bacterium]